MSAYGGSIVGRADELGRLRAALARAERGSGGAVFLGGEAGVGKTRLLGELERNAARRGIGVVRGDCTAFPGAAPYAPVVEALRGLRREAGRGAFDELVDAARPVLARLLPELGEAESGGDAALARARLFRVLRALLARTAARAPLVVAIEDLQWADRSTLAFLSSLLGRLRDQRLLLVCTHRSDELHRRHRLRPFLADAEREPAVELIELGGLAPEAFAAHVAAVRGHAAEPRVAARLHALTGGNPFFAQELLTAGAGAGAGLRELVSARLARLPDDVRFALRVAAIAGREPLDRLVAAVAPLPDAGLRAAVAEGVLVADGEGCAFGHALFREAADADLLPGERAAVHVALARALRDDRGLRHGSPAAQLAHHWTAAHCLPDALAACVRAGLEAERLLAFPEARRHFELALEVWDLVEDAEARSPIGFEAVVAHATNAASVAGEHHRAAALGRAAHRLGLV